MKKVFLYKMSLINITGTLIKNYFHCRRQAWLYYYGVNFRNEKTKVGNIQHEEKNGNEVYIDGVKIDNIDFDIGLITEYKKSFSNLEGSKMQALYYLYILEKKGLFLRARIFDIDNNMTYDLVLNKENREKLYELFKKIEILLKGDVPDSRYKKKCKDCSFYEYCFS